MRLGTAISVNARFDPSPSQPNHWMRLSKLSPWLRERAHQPPSHHPPPPLVTPMTRMRWYVYFEATLATLFCLMRVCCSPKFKCYYLTPCLSHICTLTHVFSTHSCSIAAGLVGLGLGSSNSTSRLSASLYCIMHRRSEGWVAGCHYS